MESNPRNINPFTDFGFKKLFGDESVKDLLLDFLNSLLENETGRIIELEYSQNENQGMSKEDRRVVFDIYCKTQKGERIIVEMQKFFQINYRERSLYYSTFAIQEQAVKNTWDFNLNAVYCISVLDFIMTFGKQTERKFLHKVNLIEEETGIVFNNKLTFIYIEIPKFDKKVEELETNFEKWLYLLRHLEFLERLPERLQSKIFYKVMDIAALVNLDRKQRMEYEESLKAQRDYQNALDARYLQGKAEGGAEVKIETAIALHKKGLELALISEVTGLSEKELKEILF